MRRKGSVRMELQLQDFKGCLISKEWSQASDTGSALKSGKLNKSGMENIARMGAGTREIFSFCFTAIIVTINLGRESKSHF